jgi:HK97 gp10 family phage protein
MPVEVTSHRIEVIEAKNEAIARALETIGLVAERYAKEKAPVDTGRLRNSISHQVDDETVYVGTNVEYAPYLEFGTGKFAESGGRPTPWSYQDSKGEWHTTNGMKPQPYLRPAIDDHMSEYKQIVQNELQNEQI